MATMRIVTMRDIGGGVNDSYSADLIGSHEVQNTSRNIRSDGNAYGPRPGYTTFANTLDGDGVVAIGPYRRNLATNDKLAMVQDSRLFTIDPDNDTSWTEVFEKFLDQKTTVDAMDATTGWTASTDCAVALDNTTYREGTGSLRLTKTGTTSTQAEMHKTISSTDFSSKYVNVYLYIADQTTLDALATTSTYTITLTDSGGSETLTYTWDKADVTLTVGTWTRLRVYIDTMTDSGSVDNTDITKVSLELTTAATSSVWAAGKIIWDYLYTSSIPVDVDMVDYRDDLFLLNGVDKPIRVNGTTVTQSFTNPASVTSANFLPAFGEIYSNSLWVAGVPTAPNTVFISKASTSANPEYAYDFSGALTSFGDANEILLKNRVTAIKKLSTAAILFTINDAWYVPGLQEFGSSVTFDVQPIGGAAGAVSQKATVVVENDIYYLTPQKEIRSIKRGFADQLSVITVPVSEKIRKFLDTQVDPDLSTVFAYYDETAKLCKFHFKALGDTRNNLVVVLDINRLNEAGIPEIYIDDGKVMSCGTSYKGTPYIGSSIIGQVYQDENGPADDDDVNIVVKRTSKEFTANNPTTQKKFRELVIYGEMSVSTVIPLEIFIDGVSVYSIEITSDDLPSVGSSEDGGIGTGAIGSFTIGEDGEEGTSSGIRYEFTKHIPIRTRGRKLRIEDNSDGNSNDYRINYMHYGFIATSQLLHPILEK